MDAEVEMFVLVPDDAAAASAKQPDATTYPNDKIVLSERAPLLMYARAQGEEAIMQVVEEELTSMYQAQISMLNAQI